MLATSSQTISFRPQPASFCKLPPTSEKISFLEQSEMCKPTDLITRRRRHRPVYLAPSYVTMDATNDEESPADATLQHYHPQDVAPHSSEQQAESSTKPETTRNGGGAASIPPSARICNVGKRVYQVLVDLLLVIWVVLMSFLVYDVDICVIKGEDDDVEPLIDDEYVVARGLSRRVIIRNEQQNRQSARSIMTGVSLM